MLESILNIALVVSGLALLLDFCLVLYLHPILNPIFDPQFKSELKNWTWLSWSGRLARAGTYATWVAQKKITHAFVASAESFDFRSKVSLRIYRLCRLHLFCIWIFVFLGFPAGLYSALAT